MVSPFTGSSLHIFNSRNNPSRFNQLSELRKLVHTIRILAGFFPLALNRPENLENGRGAKEKDIWPPEQPVSDLTKLSPFVPNLATT